MKLSRRPHPLRRLNVEVTGTQFAMARALREARERVQAKIAAMAARAAQDGREQAGVGTVPFGTAADALVVRGDPARKLLE